MPPDPRRNGTVVLSGAMLLLGVAIVARTVGAGGGVLSVGVLLGILFVLAGGGRLWIALRRP